MKRLLVVLFLYTMTEGCTSRGRSDHDEDRLRDHESGTDESTPVPRLTVNGLYRQFGRDFRSATENYEGRVIELTGRLLGVSGNPVVGPGFQEGRIYVALEPATFDSNMIRFVMCGLLDEARRRASNLEKDSVVTLRGRFKTWHSGSCPIIEDCQFVDQRRSQSEK